MIKPSYPWPTPPSTPMRGGYRMPPYKCHNCGSEEHTLGVGSWISDYSNYTKNKLVLCKQCFVKLNNEMVGRDYVQSLWTRIKILFTGRLK